MSTQEEVLPKVLLSMIDQLNHLASICLDRPPNAVAETAIRKSIPILVEIDTLIGKHLNTYQEDSFQLPTEYRHIYAESKHMLRLLRATYEDRKGV